MDKTIENKLMYVTDDENKILHTKIIGGKVYTLKICTTQKIVIMIINLWPPE